MSLAVVYSRAQSGIEAPLVTVEAHLANGLPSLAIVGLPAAAVKESKDRVRSAIINSRFEFPTRRITINLAPADLPKEGGRFDLPIALGILAASGQIKSTGLEQYEFLGELALSGALRAVQGSVPAIIQTRSDHRALILPSTNAEEAALVKEVSAFGANHLLEVCAHINGTGLINEQPPTAIATHINSNADIAEVNGQYQAKRALEIAAAGQHSLLMLGPPGTGKTMLASRLPGILPPMTEPEALECAAIQSITSTGFKQQEWGIRPFRAPHHTASGVALVGGGSQPKPGEISLAHNGILFLDELPEFDRKVLEVLREPLENGSITISRATSQAHFPARFQLIAAMNPCPCGYWGDPNGSCRCTPDQISRYRGRISGPLMDRIDMHIEVARQAIRVKVKQSPEDSSAVRQRVTQTRNRQLERNGKSNAQLTASEVKQHCSLDEHDDEFLEQTLEQLQLSARAYHRVLKVARTIADLEGVERINRQHLIEAIGFRRLDRKTVVSQ